MAVCNACKKAPHSAQPIGCAGGTWCDCQHRLPKLDQQVVKSTEEKKEND